MNHKTISDKRYMKYEYRIEQPLQMVQINLKMIITNSPNLINSLGRSINHPLIRKYGNIPFVN